MDVQDALSSCMRLLSLWYGWQLENVRTHKINTSYKFYRAKAIKVVQIDDEKKIWIAPHKLCYSCLSRSVALEAQFPKSFTLSAELFRSFLSFFMMLMFVQCVNAVAQSQRENCCVFVTRNKERHVRFCQTFFLPKETFVWKSFQQKLGILVIVRAIKNNHREIKKTCHGF
jgi:hypothetical protein